MMFQALLKIGQYLTTSMVKNMDRISYGRLYKIKGRWHRASKRGEPPNNFSNNLKKTIRFYPRRAKSSVVVSLGNARISYGRFLESDGLNRKNLYTIVEKEKVELKKIIQEELKKDVLFEMEKIKNRFERK